MKIGALSKSELRVTNAKEEEEEDFGEERSHMRKSTINNDLDDDDWD